MGQYTIGTLAKGTGVSIETIRYYQRRGLIEEPQRPPGGIRRYTHEHVRRVWFIREAQTLGFSLHEIHELLVLEDGKRCSDVEQLGARKLHIVRAKIAQLRRVEKVLDTLVKECHRNVGKMGCPLIAALEDKKTVGDAMQGIQG